MQAGSGKAPVTPVTVRVTICALAKPCKEKKMPPRDMVSVKLGGIGTESAGNRAFVWVAGMREGRIPPKV